MTSLLEMLSPEFLLRDALFTSIIIGFIAPLLGVYLVLRRMVFLGVALPQVSAAGISTAFLAYSLLASGHQHGGEGEFLLALGGSVVVTTVVLFILAFFEGRGYFTSEARTGVVYGAAAAFTVLALSKDPQGEAEMINILRGDALAATPERLAVLTMIYFPVLALLFFFRRPLLLVSFDRELAKVFRMGVKGWDTLLYLCIGITVAVGVMNVGPLVVFGFLTLPVLIGRILVSRLNSLMFVSSLCGGLGSFAGFYFAYVLDLPLGPTEVAILFLLLVVVWMVRWIFSVFSLKTASDPKIVGH